MGHPTPSPSPFPTATLATLLALYLAQGLPSGLFAHALPVFWREAGVELVWIGALKLLALPWVLKAFWAPLVERQVARTSPLGWIITLQLTAAVLLAGLGVFGLTPAPGALIPVVVLIAAINLLMATQDIVTDGLAVRLVPPHWRGLANTVQVAGYKIGMLAGGAALLLLADHLPPPGLLWFPVVLLVVLLALVGRSRALHRADARTSGRERPPLRLSDGFLGLVRAPGMGFWLVIVASYKIADALGSGMIRPMLTDGGWTTQAIGTFTVITTVAGLVGAGLGGWLFTRLGARRSLIWAGMAQALTILAWALVPMLNTATMPVYAVGIAEQLADGASTVVLFALMMGVCRRAWAGADFTLQASIQVVAGGVFGLLGGAVAQATGYATLFVSAGVSGLVVVTVYALKTRASARISVP